MNSITSTKCNVMIVTPVILVGGTEIHTLSLVRVLVEAGYPVIVCCYYESDLSMVKQMEEAGADVVLLHLDRSRGHFGANKILELIRNLIVIFRNYQPDIVHVQYLAPGLVPIIAARIAGIPTIFATVHIAGRIAYGWKTKILLRLAARLCTAFFCVSKGVEDFWFGDSLIFNHENIPKRRRHFTIFNAIDIAKIHKIISYVNSEEVKTSLGISDKPVIGIVGRLTYQKGQDILFDAMGEIIEKIPDVILIVIGEGPDRMKLEDKAKSLGIENHILWLGVQQQDRVFQLYSIMDVLAMPSRYEGFGLTAAEAMVAGIPVVGTKIEGLSEIIEDGVTGYLIPANDSKKLSDALLKLLTDSEKAKMMGTKGSQRVKELFSLEVFKISVLAAYEKLSK